MSFILDALRKSEHERQRSAIPGVSQVPFAAPPREVPRWTLAVIVALAAALLALGAAWWQSSRERPAGVDTTAARTVIPLDLPPSPVRQAPSPASQLPSAEPPPDEAPAPSSQRASVPAPVAPPARELPPRAAPAAPERAEPPLPSATALAAEGIAVPALRLELLAFSEVPAERFAFINGARYREGETLRDGPRLVSIERGGAVLSLQGRRFLLAPE